MMGMQKWETRVLRIFRKEKKTGTFENNRISTLDFKQNVKMKIFINYYYDLSLSMFWNMYNCERNNYNFYEYLLYIKIFFRLD